jgi:hypothetical protein
MAKRNKDDTHIVANHYVPKAMRTHLGDLSLKAFGARGKWKKLANRYGLDVPDIIDQMEAINKYKKENPQNVEQNFKPTRQQRRKYLRYRQKIRQRKATNVSNTTKSVDGSGSSNGDGGK